MGKSYIPSSLYELSKCYVLITIFDALIIIYS